MCRVRSATIVRSRPARRESSGIMSFSSGFFDAQTMSRQRLCGVRHWELALGGAPAWDGQGISIAVVCSFNQPPLVAAL